MVNRRVLREVVFLCCLCATADGIQNKAQYRLLTIGGPFPLVGNIILRLDSQFSKSDKNKFIASVQKLVNRVVPTGFLMWAPEMKFWFAGQVCLRLVASGWHPPLEGDLKDFVQRLYDVGRTFNPGKAPSNIALTHLMTMPERLREKEDMFK